MWRFYDSSGRVKQNTKPTISLVTALPSGPQDGDQVIFTDSLTAPTYQWLLRYVAAKSTNKWVFVGGPPVYAEVTTAETTSSASYTALATAGPSVAVPVAGDYFVSIGFLQTSQATSRGTIFMSYDIGATGAVDADGAQTFGLDASTPSKSSVMRMRKKSALTAVTLTAKYKTSSGTTGFGDRWIELVPIALGG